MEIKFDELSDEYYKDQRPLISDHFENFDIAQGKCGTKFGKVYIKHSLFDGKSYSDELIKE